VAAAADLNDPLVNHGGMTLASTPERAVTGTTFVGAHATATRD
jgi:hypothetical protein